MTHFSISTAKKTSVLAARLMNNSGKGNAIIPNRFWAGAQYVIIICRIRVITTAPNIGRFVNNPILKRDSRSDRIAKAFPICDKVSVVNVIVCQ